MINGIMLDPARTLQPLNYYKSMLDYCAEWGMNTLLFHFTDDQGCAIKLDTIPGAACKGAFSKKDIQHLLAHASRLGIDVIPEVESFGHTLYLTSLPKYKHLLDLAGINPCHPESVPLFAGIYKEVAGLFPSRYVHIGCDEVRFGNTKESKKALETKPKWRVYADYVNVLAGQVVALGREPMFWDDHAANEPAMLKILDQRLICVDWIYWEKDLAKYLPRLQMIVKAGFRVIPAPALAWCEWGVQSGQPVLAATRMMTLAMRKVQSPRIMGFINTIWCPARYLPETLRHGIAASAMLVRNPFRSWNKIADSWVQAHFGVKPDKQWRSFINRLYQAGLPLYQLTRTNWYDYESLALALCSPSIKAKRWDAALGLARKLSKKTNRNRKTLDQLTMVFQLRRHWDDRLESARELLSKTNLKPGALSKAFQRVFGRDRSMADKCLEIWRRYYSGKHPNVAIKVNFGLESNLYALLDRAADYTRELASGQKKALAKLDSVREVAQVWRNPLPGVNVPLVHVEQTPGNPQGMNWEKAVKLAPWRTLLGFAADRKIETSLMHDGQYLYVRLQEKCATSKLLDDPDIFCGDEWEIFFAPQPNKKPYYQLAVNPGGKCAALAYEGDSGAAPWKCGAKAVSDISASNQWSVYLAIPCDKLFPGSRRAGLSTYANFYRGAMSGKYGTERVMYAWSPNFVKGFHELGRLGKLTLS